MRRVLSERAKRLPQRGYVVKASFWCGLRPMAPDGMPIVGLTPYANLYLGTGHGTLSSTMAPGTGRVLVDLLSRWQPVLLLDGLTMAPHGRVGVVSRCARSAALDIGCRSPVTSELSRRGQMARGQRSRRRAYRPTVRTFVVLQSLSIAHLAGRDCLRSGWRSVQGGMSTGCRRGDPTRATAAAI